MPFMQPVGPRGRLLRSLIGRRGGSAADDPERLVAGIRRAILLLVLVFLIGVAGFKLIEGQGLLQAVYNTTITLSTVGFERPVGAGELSAGGKVFTVFLIWGGVGIVAYLLMQVVGFVVSGQLSEVMRGRKMERIIDSLRDHIVVCGTKETGEQAVVEFVAADTPVVVVCESKDYVEQFRARLSAARHGARDLLSVVGPPAEAETLRRANVAGAKALLACLGTDAENVFLVMTARETVPGLLIVAEATDPSTIDKLRKVGADHVVAPAVIAGTRMASVALRPSALAFLDVLTHSGEEALRLEEVAIPEGSRWSGATLSDVKIPQRAKLLVIGVRRAGGGRAPAEGGDGGFVFNPSAGEALHAGDRLIVLGTPEQRGQLEALLSEERPA